MRTKSLKKNKINVITLGCSKNVYDSEVLMGQLRASGKDVTHEAKAEDEGNIIVINTCGFIDNAKAESVNMILEYAQKKEEGLVDKVFVTGCLSERYRPDLEKEIPNIDQYFGTTELPHLLKALGADYKHELLGERLTTTPKNYAYLKIAEGCDRPCSFCAIPLMRGKHVSQPIEKLVKEALKIEGEQERQDAIIYLGKLMKTFYGAWNKETLDDSVILKDIQAMSGGALNMTLEKVREDNLFEKLYREQRKTKPHQSNNSGQRREGGGGHRPFNKNNKNNNFRRRRDQ